MLLGGYSKEDFLEYGRVKSIAEKQVNQAQWLPKQSCLLYLHTQKSLTTTPKVYYELQVSTKIIYIYFLSSGQASKQAGPPLACWLAQIRPFGLLACLITNQASQASCQASLLNSKSDCGKGNWGIAAGNSQGCSMGLVR